ncbi:hypothetical protein HK101_002945 [Irineochytrium annulatum]|nr:hypothetical protein HK101_002945 [Irineochytrium annulatum]
MSQPGPPAPVAAAGGGAAPNGQAPAQGGIMSFLQTISRVAIMWWIFNYFMGSGNKPTEPPKPSLNTDTGKMEFVKPEKAPASYQPLWSTLGASTDLYVYVSEDEDFSSFGDVSRLVWKETGINFGDKKDVRTKEATWDLSKEVQHNGSLYAHVYLTPRGRSPNPLAKTYLEEGTLYTKKILTRYLKKRKVVVKKKLVAAATSAKESEPEPTTEDDEDDEEEDLPIISYYWPNITVVMVPDAVAIPANSPPPIASRLRLYKDFVHYYPFFEVNDFWMLSENLLPLNETVKKVDMHLRVEQWSNMYFQALCQFEESFKMQQGMMGVEQKETDEIKRMFLETNPILLAVTMFVSLLHSVFDFLAFKNDIAFWKDKKDLDGMSFRAIIMNVAFQLIIFLYLLDNETSWMIIISSGVGLAIEAWKIQKTVDIKRIDAFPFFEFKDKYKPSKTARKTMKYDKIAFKYLSYVFYPLLVGYAIYSVMYEEHKSWYSYIVGTLVGFVYMFGFISMTPQLFINYKLKSVAHMPWKTFMYKALNTFIDDVVFLVYLYQRWIYPEDKKRRNEFGQVGETGGDEDDDDEDDDEDDDGTKKEKEVNEVDAKSIEGKAKDDGVDGLRKRNVDEKKEEKKEKVEAGKAEGKKGK